MAVRAMWKAEISIDALMVPVKLYSAVQDRSVRFRLLHKTDQMPVMQQMVAPGRNDPIPAEEIRKGIEIERGVYVMLTSDELAELEPQESREIRVEQVIDREQLDERWFDRTYYLGPDADTESYFALSESLAGDNCVAIARWTMRKKRYAGALHGAQGYLVLETLRFANEIVKIDVLRTPPNRAPDDREISLAEQLISALEDEFDAASYKDEYREQVLDLVEAKALGNVVTFPKEKVSRRKGSLVASLEASLKNGTRAASGS
ncbi:Ku protein [soil metagenome]